MINYLIVKLLNFEVLTKFWTEKYWAHIYSRLSEVELEKKMEINKKMIITLEKE
jgi:mitochondrial fission protein ELM1